MENLEQPQNQLTTTPEKLAELAKAVYHFNYLTAFPVADYMLEAWAKVIAELEPEITPEVVKWIIDRMKTGHIAYNDKIGIQNVFNGFRVYISAKIQELKENPPEREKWSSLYKKYRITPDPFLNSQL